MELDEYNWRRITFEGFTFPPSLMAISVLEPILEMGNAGDKTWATHIQRIG